MAETALQRGWCDCLDWRWVRYRCIRSSIYFAHKELHNRFQTYFPHVDNIYSHRSTQRYKRKPFVSHYWDCRLKGRPPGTPKSEDPNKKKRKRHARERDLCDVKIKITEYFPGARSIMGDEINNVEPSTNDSYFVPNQAESLPPNQAQPRAFAMLGSNDGNVPTDIPGNDGRRYYTIQRVNGNGGNGKGDGTAGPHKHTLEESDRVKKNSISRHFLKEEKVKKKAQVRPFFQSGFVFDHTFKRVSTSNQKHPHLHTIMHGPRHRSCHHLSRNVLQHSSRFHEK